MDLDLRQHSGPGAHLRHRQRRGHHRQRRRDQRYPGEHEQLYAHLQQRGRRDRHGANADRFGSGRGELGNNATSNNYGQLGDGTLTDSVTPAAVSGLPSAATAVVAGYWYSCALMANETVTCWGEGDYNELGNGSGTDSSLPVTVVEP